MPKKKISPKAATQTVSKTKAKESKTAAKPAKAKQTKVVRARSVRGAARASILASLASGPKTRQQLIAASGATLASFYLNLKQLKDEKKIVVGGRGGVVRLNNPESGDAEVDQAKKVSLPALRMPGSPDVAVIPQFVSGALQDALEAVNARFVALDRIGEKLHTLEQLSRTLPAPVAEVLLSIHGDLMKLSPARAARSS